MLRKPSGFNRLHWQEIKQEVLNIKYVSCVKNTKNIFFINGDRVTKKEFEKTPIKNNIAHCEYEIEFGGVYRENKIIGSLIIIQEYAYYSCGSIEKHRWEIVKDNDNTDITIVQFRDTIDFCNKRYNLIKKLEQKQLNK